MSGTFWKLKPLEKPTAAGCPSPPGGVIHCMVVPSEIHGVMPPCRCRVARFSVKHILGFIIGS